MSKKHNTIAFQTRVLIASIFILFLLTVGKLDVMLWGDESLRAMIGNSTFLKGFPTHWDGTRYVVGVDESMFSKLFPGKYVEISSWFQYYLIGASYAVFGMSTFTVRFFFWIAAFFIFYVLYRYRHLFPQCEKVYIFITVMLLLNATFLIYALQANYYIYALLFTLLSSSIFIEIIKKYGAISIKSLIFLIIINQLLAHNHIPTAVSIFLAQAVFFCIKALEKGMANKMKIIVYIVISSALLFFDYRLYGSNNSIQPGKLFWTGMVVFLNGINFYAFPFVGFLFLIGIVFWYRSAIQGKIWFVYIGLVTIIHLILLSYVAYNGAMPFRYVSSLMILWYIALALVMVSVPKRWAVILFCFAVIPNFYSGISKLFTTVILPRSVMEMVRRDIPTIPLISDSKIRCFYCEYMDELTNHYPHPLDSVINELNKMNVVNKKIAVGPCEGNTIMFYTKGIVIDQIPEKLYRRIYKKSFELSDADFIVNNSFCPSQLKHEDIIKLGYRFIVVPMPSPAFINDGEFNVRSIFSYPFNPLAVIYIKNNF